MHSFISDHLNPRHVHAYFMPVFSCAQCKEDRRFLLELNQDSVFNNKST
jgi:tartrate dehydratase alpha subunit/fumarate hydratase class I-like protein